MNNRRRIIVLWSIVAFLIATTLLLGLACDPAFPLQIENRTDMVLTPYIGDVNVGEVEPNRSIKVKGLGGTHAYYLIEAKNSKGEVVYSRKFSFDELDDADWKVVIAPLQNK